MAIAAGITGGIGSGKSTVCRVFKILGIPVFEADKVARQLMNTNEFLKSGLIRLYGKGIYTRDGEVDRKKLAGIVFNSDFELSKVNKLVHPLVRENYLLWLEKQDSVYVIHEAAILFESGFYKMMDLTILVTAPVEQRIERILYRDNTNEKEIRERMAKQWPDEKKRELATFELVNDNSRLLIPEIIQMDKKIKKHGKIW